MLHNCYICPDKQSIMELSKLKGLRKSKEVSIKELSRITGLNRDRISLIERGLVNPSFESVKKIIEALGSRIEIIF